MDDYHQHELMQWDAPLLFELTGNPRVTKYLGFKTHETVHDASRLIEAYRTSPGQWFGSFIDGRLAGVVGIERQGHSATMAVYASPHARGFGRMTAAPIVDFVLSQPGVWRVWAFCHVDNVPVQRVMERLGAVQEGCMRRYAMFPNVSDEPQDCFLYAITK
jgi:RimJ/RimL family protein N-acetyltransferase